MMDAAALNAWMDRHFTRSAFRLETLQTYEVASDGSDYKRYLDGEPTWTPERKQPWLDHLAAERAAGLRRSRVRVVTHPVTPYTRYACEWGYGPNVAAGEDVRIYDVGPSGHWPHTGEFGTTDWWLVTDSGGITRGAVMKYGADGQFQGAVEILAPTLLRGMADQRNKLWADAEPFPMWWERHPDLHRDHDARARTG